MKVHSTIPTYIIHNKAHIDRREHIIEQFSGRDEFSTTIVDTYPHELSTIGLWNTIRHIIKDLVNPQSQFILICKDDHLFTEDYSKETLQHAISEAKSLGADVLSGGVSRHEDAVEISDTLFWVKKFSGTQFIVIFNLFFQVILDADFTPIDTVDAKMAFHSDCIYFMHPFISIQKEFNNGSGKAEDLFSLSAARATMNRDIHSVFKNTSKSQEGIDDGSFEDMSIPVYIINLPERTERREHILNQFEGRPEFDPVIVEACKNEIGALGLWQSVRKVIRLAIENDDDAIVICEDDHEFTPHYSKELLFRNIYLAHQQGCDYFSGGSGKVDLAIPISENLFWASHCLSTQFIIVYRKFFQTILDSPFDETVIGDIKLSALTGNKMIFYPFISGQKDFGYSDVTKLHNLQQGIVQHMFAVTADRLQKMHNTFIKHHK